MIRVAEVQAPQTSPPEWVRDELGGATGSGIRVAVLDSGWDRSIGDARVLPGVGFVDPDDDFALARNDDDQDVLGHGTACADVILGVAPDARIIPVKVFGKKLETSPGTLETALHWAIEAGVQVINVSLGTRLEGTLHPLYRACERARQAGIIIVAAGHNGNDWSYPAIFENVIGVSAARFDSPYHFYYRAEHAMECVGWGVDRPVLWVGGERVVRHGTSFAAPGVAGIVSLILERHPDARLEDVREMLARFALPGGEDATPSPAPPPAPAKKPRKRAEAADQPASAKKPGKRAAAPAKAADTTPARPATRSRKQPASADSQSPAKSSSKSRKQAATADSTAPAKSASKPRKQAATADSAAPGKAASKSRKQTATADSAAPAKSASKPWKQVATAGSAAPGKAASKSRKQGATADSAAPAKSASKSRKQTATADSAAPAKADSAAPAKAASKARQQPAT